MEKPRPKYRYAVYRKHHSGIGGTFVRWEYTDEKPSFDTGFFFDVTNHEWAKDE